MNPADGRLHLQKYNWMERIYAESALAAIGNMADIAAAWRRVLADYRSSSWRTETSAPPIGSEPLLQV